MLVHWTKPAERDLRRLDRSQSARVVEAIGRFAATGQGDVKALKGSATKRLRVGPYRVRFDSDGQTLECTDQRSTSGADNQVPRIDCMRHSVRSLMNLSASSDARRLNSELDATPGLPTVLFFTPPVLFLAASRTL